MQPIITGATQDTAKIEAILSTVQVKFSGSMKDLDQKINLITKQIDNLTSQKNMLISLRDSSVQEIAKLPISTDKITP